MTGDVVLITGAARGIGAEAAKAFAHKGMRVALLARKRSDLDGLAASIGGNVLCYGADVADWRQVADVVADITARAGGVDILVNNAGVIDPMGPLATLDPDDWARAMAVNVNGVFHGIRACLPGMLERGRGTVLTLSSGAAHRATSGWGAYCSSKAAVAMAMQMLHLEYGGQGIRALSLSPGTVATDMQARTRDSGVNSYSNLDWSVHVPPDWPAKALVWMASAAADAHLGQELSLREAWLRKELGLE